MITLYHCMGARSFRPLWMLEELELPYELHVMPFPPRTLEPEFLARNPLGTVPFFLDGEAAMTESSAICEFLAARYAGGHRMRVDPDEQEFDAYLQWLYFGEATLTFPLAIVARYSRLEPEENRLPQASADYARWFMARLRGVERRLADRVYLCANRFTAADVSVGYALMLASYLQIDFGSRPAVTAYWQRLQARPAFLRALAAQARSANERGVPPVPAPLTSPV